MSVAYDADDLKRRTICDSLAAMVTKMKLEEQTTAA